MAWFSGYHQEIVRRGTVKVAEARKDNRFSLELEDVEVIKRPNIEIDEQLFNYVEGENWPDVKKYDIVGVISTIQSTVAKEKITGIEDEILFLLKDGEVLKKYEIS